MFEYHLPKTTILCASNIKVVIIKKTCILLITILFFCFPSAGQSDKTNRSNSIALEVGGPGGWYSLQYGRVLLNKNKYQLEANIRFSSYHFRDFTQRINPDFVIPLSLQFLYGYQSKLSIELGHTIGSIVKVEETNFRPKRNTDHHLFFQVAYQYRKKNSPWFFAVGYTFLMEWYQKIRHWGNLSMGYYF